MNLVLFEPDIPQNTGSMLRLAACLGVNVDLIEPFGFVFDEKRMRRSGMDYLDKVEIQKHSSWQAYQDSKPDGRLILATTKGSKRLDDFKFQPHDRLLMGRESAGVPDHVHDAADARVYIPMMPDTRSLNVAQSAAILLFEAQRQTNALPKDFS